MESPPTKPDQPSSMNFQLLWLFVILAIPGLIILAFYLNGYLGI